MPSIKSSRKPSKPVITAAEEAEQYNELYSDGVELSCRDYDNLMGHVRSLLSVLADNINAWEGEEDSVKEEHETLIERTNALLARLGPIYHKGGAAPESDDLNAAHDKLSDILEDTDRKTDHKAIRAAAVELCIVLAGRSV